MRKMFSQEQIKKIAQEAGGGLPEIQSGDAGKALVVNQAEDGAEWAEVGSSPEIKVITLDFGAAKTLTVSEDIATNVTNLVYDFIFIKHGNTIDSLPRNNGSNLSPYGIRYFTAASSGTKYVKWLGGTGTYQIRLQVQDSTTLKITYSNSSVLSEQGDGSRISMEIPDTETSVSEYSLMQWAYPANKLQTWATYYAQINGNTVFFYPTYYDATNGLLYLRSQVCSANSTVYEAVININTKKASYSTVQ